MKPVVRLRSVILCRVGQKKKPNATTMTAPVKLFGKPGSMVLELMITAHRSVIYCPPYCEQTIVHGGTQSMALLYNNEAGIMNSEVSLTLTAPRDWTAKGFGEL